MLVMNGLVNEYQRQYAPYHYSGMRPQHVYIKQARKTRNGEKKQQIKNCVFILTRFYDELGAGSPHNKHQYRGNHISPCADARHSHTDYVEQQIGG